MKFNFFKNNNEKNGFTLVETLVAISILMISIAGPVIFVGNGIQASRYAADQVTAYYLAQDAVEALRFLRDNNRIENITTGNSDWHVFDSDLSRCSTDVCTIDTTKTYRNSFNSLDGEGLTEFIKTVDSSESNDAILYVNNGYYSHDPSGERTKFKRTFTYLHSVNADGYELKVTLIWKSGMNSRNFSITENLFKWQ